MDKPKHGYKHCVYVILNKPLKMAYVGVTRQVFKKRIKQHKANDNGTNSRLIANLPDTEFIQLTDYDYASNNIKGLETK